VRINNDDDDDTSVAAGLRAVTPVSLVGSNTEAVTGAVVPDPGRVARVLGAGQHREAVAVERRPRTQSHTRTVAVQNVADVAVEARLEHHRRRSERRHTMPIGRRQTTHVDVAVVLRLAERTAST